MPERWFVPVTGVDSTRVRLDFVHAAFSRWFDDNDGDHEANEKPYAISPMTEYAGRVGVEIATLTASAAGRVATREGSTIRLGNQIRPVGTPWLMHTASWDDLVERRPEREWTFELVTPTTFRSGDRSSPLPSVATILRGLYRSWSTWSTVPDADVGYDARLDTAVWVSDLDLRSAVVPLTVRGRKDTPVHLSGSLGRLALRCDDPATAARVTPLMHLAPYAGFGSMRGKGLGVVRLARAVPFQTPVATPTRHAEDAALSSGAREMVDAGWGRENGAAG